MYLSSIREYDELLIESSEREQDWNTHIVFNETQNKILKSIIEVFIESNEGITFLEKIESPYLIIEALREILQFKAQNDELSIDKSIQAYILITELEESLFS